MPSNQEKNIIVQDQCTQNVMRRVRRVYRWNTFGKPFFIECVLLGSAIGGSFFLVSISNVYSNAADRKTIVDISRFAMSAFSHTELSIKALSLGMVTLAVLVTRDSIHVVGRVFRRIRFGSVA